MIIFIHSNLIKEFNSDKMFEKVHGTITLHYTVYLDKKVILLTNITPEDILDEAHASELETYKGVIISKSNPQKDIFKVNNKVAARAVYGCYYYFRS